VRQVDSVLLVAFGGPEKPADVRPFLEIVTAGRRIPAERLDAVAHHYELIGGRSPLTELTLRQAAGLREALAREGLALPVQVGMRNWHPFLRETLAEMREAGRRRALGVILSAFQTEASWTRYMRDVDEARAKIGAGAPEVAFAPGWSDHPRFLDAMTARVSEALGQAPPQTRGDACVIFTAHSVPTAMARESAYADQLEAAARAIAARLGHERWQIAYQSRSGSSREPWLEPDVCDVLRGLEGKGIGDVVVAPIGFACDHVEILYDLDVEARGVAEQLGLRFHRAAAANDHPFFIAMLVDLVKREVGAA
jgi:protoporphyrin/coproporphyrin ferrochelatase